MNTDLFDNPMGLDGFEFVEFTGPNHSTLDSLFTSVLSVRGGFAADGHELGL